MADESVSLVVPGRNCAGTLRECLAAVTPLLGYTPLGEIIFVDDGSTDHSAEIAREFPVRYVRSHGKGPGASRNLGWRAAKHPLVWFVDADCVAEPDALALLLPHFADPRVGGVSGSYGIMNPESRLAGLIHEEIIERHRGMPLRVNFLATFNVVYRREVLAKVRGFDERFLKAQDAELAFRVMEAGYELRFVFDSRVKHYHADRLRDYLRTQRQQGYWRVWLHLSHRGHAVRDSYSNWVDHTQPPLAVLMSATVPLVLWGRFAWVPVGLLAFLFLLQVPMTVKLTRRTRQVRHLLFGPLSLIRAFWRGMGMIQGALGYVVAAARWGSGASP